MVENWESREELLKITWGIISKLTTELDELGAGQTKGIATKSLGYLIQLHSNLLKDHEMTTEQLFKLREEIQSLR